MRFIVTLFLILLPVFASAQGAATLVADSVTVPAGGQKLIAQGNVEVFFDGTRLSAARITFDQAGDRLTIDGPVLIVAPDGTILTADVASLDPQLKNGILRGARLVLEDKLQLAATQIDRVGGRFTQLYQVAATSCRVCIAGGTPLWEIRARRVIHDQEERQLYFDDATFRVAGVPIAYIPRMRLPDPTLTRATGVLIPRIASSNSLGTGIKLPYFIALDDHRDITFTPYLSTSTATLETRYRHAFLRGELNVNAAVTNDDLTDDMRSYVFADGIFDLGEDITLRFDVEYTSDDAYLLEYGFSSKDRLDSEIAFERVRDRDLTRASLTYLTSLRAGEVSETLPPVLAEINWERRITPAWGGTLTVTSDLQSHYRETSALDVGRDVSRIGLGTKWHRNTATDIGLVLDGTLGFTTNYFNVSDDSDTDDTFRATAFAQTTLRYPLIRKTARATHVLEPVVQLAWSALTGGKVENEDSRATEFDQSNLLALSRFSGQDAVETGVRGAAGLTWTRVGGPETQFRWDSTLSVGRVFRADPDPNFSTSSGLGTATSDWLIAGQLRTPVSLSRGGLSLETRLLVNDGLNITKTETRARWTGTDLNLTTGYIFLPADTDESRATDVSEWTIDAAYRINDRWQVGADARYDVLSDNPTQAGFDVGWQNECVTVDFSVSRRFTSSTTITPSTDFGLEIGLNGFSAGRAISSSSRQCTD